MHFLRLLGRFIPKFKWRILAYIFLNVVSSICSAFSFMAVIPLLKVLFGLSKETFEYIDFSSVNSYGEAVNLLVNNSLYALQQQISIHDPARALLLIGAFIIMMSLLSNVISYFAYWVRIPIRTGISKDLRRSAYSQILHMKTSSFTNENKGDFVSRMTNDVEEIEYGIGSTLDMLIKDPVKIIVLVIAMMGISNSLTVYALILTVVSSIIVFLLGKRMTAISLKAQSLRGKILSTFEQAVGALPTIKAFNAERRFEIAFASINDETRRTFNKQNRYYSIAWPSMDFFLTCALVLILCIGGEIIFEGKSSLQASELIGFLIIFQSLISPMRDMLKCTFGIRKAIASANRIKKISNVECESTSGGKINLEDSVFAIRFEGVKKSYDNIPILNDVSLCIRKGENVAIVGNTGAGKSTIAMLITRMISPDSGKILIGDIDISCASIESLRYNVCYIGQDTTLFNDTIFNNITLLSEATKVDVVKAAKAVGIHDFIEALPDKYETIVGDRGLKLSGGQKQCISIARAILTKPQILILDESTAALDAGNRLRVDNAIRNLMHGKTTLTISHQSGSIMSADRVIAIAGGHVVEEGIPTELLATDGYLSAISKLW